MPPRKRASTDTATSGPSKRARDTEEEAITPEAEASGPETNAPEPPRSPRQVPRPARFSDVSATANTWQHWRHFVEKDPGHAYAFVCFCRLPHHRGPADLDPFEEVDPEEEDDEDEEEPALCDGGETCICQKPAGENPEHKWVLSRAGYRMLVYQHILTSIRSPDSFGMRTINDHGALGALEVVENLLVDFDEFKEGWRDRWAVCEAVVLYFLGHASEDLFMLPDSEKLEELVTLVATMFLTMLHQLENERLLAPDSEVANIGMVMGLYIEFLYNMKHDYGLLEPGTPEDGSQTGGSASLGGGISAYAKKHGIEIKGAEVLDDLVPEVDENAEVPEGDDPWGWGERYEEYAKELGMGGDEWDITTWKPKERKEAAFDGKDPMSREMIREVRAGAIMQPA